MFKEELNVTDKQLYLALETQNGMEHLVLVKLKELVLPDLLGMGPLVSVFNQEHVPQVIIKLVALVLVHQELNVLQDLAGMEDIVLAQETLFVQVVITSMELNALFKPQQHVHQASNFLVLTVLLKPILLVLMEDFGMDLLALFKLKEFALVDIHLMLEFAPKILQALVLTVII